MKEVIEIVDLIIYQIFGVFAKQKTSTLITNSDTSRVDFFLNNIGIGDYKLIDILPRISSTNYSTYIVERNTLAVYIRINMILSLQLLLINSQNVIKFFTLNFNHNI